MRREGWLHSLSPVRGISPSSLFQGLGPWRYSTGVLAVATALALVGVTPGETPAQTSQNPQPAGPVNQLAAVTLARGIQPAPLFGEGPVVPIDPTTTFINTDLPYAVVKIKSLLPDTVMTLRVIDPAGAEMILEVKSPPPRKGAWEDFDFALPIYILGTDLEGHTGTWHFLVSLNGRPQGDTPFEWQQATPLALSRIRDAVEESSRNADLHWRYGAALALQGHAREAIPELLRAIQLDHRYALYYITLGRIYEREGRPQDAVRAFQTALTLHGSVYDAVFSGWARAHLAKLPAR